MRPCTSVMCLIVGVSLVSFVAAEGASTTADQKPPLPNGLPARASDGIQEARRQFIALNLRARFHETHSRLTRVYGEAFGFGTSPHDTAEQFRLTHADLFGAAPDDLLPVSPLHASSNSQGVLYDPAMGEYKFTLVYYSEHKDGIPVFGSDIRLLVRNEPGNPLVLASSQLIGVGEFAVDRALAEAPFDPAVQAETGMTNFTEAKSVIWAGLEDMIVDPVLAVTFIGDNRGDITATQPERWRFVCDAVTGAVLYREDMILRTDVSGNVSGWATPGPEAIQCAPAVLVPFPYARVSIQGGSSTFADVDGNFSILNGGTSAVTVLSPMNGQFFEVINAIGSADNLSMVVVPPGPADFVHGSAGPSEYVDAQINAYVYANEVRDWALFANPTYPVICSQTDFPIYVNRSGCPGDAWYNGASLNFCGSSDDYGNTASSTTIQHEYGHHLVQSGGSGQGEYGEGMADCVAMLIADDPGVAYGYYYDQCETPLRNADNDCQYDADLCSSCGSEIHLCGKLLSGCVWDIRNALVLTEPVDYLRTLADLTVNSILLHTGTSIDEQIAIDFLTLDDNDGNILNGTPHYPEICAGFESHGIDCPDLQAGLSVSPAQQYVSEGPNGGPFLPASMVYTVENLGPGALTYSVTKTADWLTVTNASGTLPNVGDTVQVEVAISSAAQSLPDAGYEDVIRFINLTDHIGDTSRSAALNVGIRQPAYEWNMNTDPGWMAEGAWAYGRPTGEGGANGPPDPASGYTGSNVYGYNLSGDYDADMLETHLTTNAIDCTGLSNVTLKFQRRLGVHLSLGDHAYVRVSNDGSHWTTVWENVWEVADYAWALQEFDISSVADDQSTVYIRWTMGRTDYAWQYCGWNIDDVQIVALGRPEPALHIHYPDGVPDYIPPASATEFTVQILAGSETYAPGTGLLHYRYDGGTYQSVSLTHDTDDLYIATLPAAACDDVPEFYISAQGDGGTTVRSPRDAPADVFGSTVGSLTIVMDDDFDTDQGWTVENSTSPALTGGAWDRGIPVGGGDRGDPANDYGGSGQCYLTENVDDNSDVDGGYTWLVSPTVDLSGGDADVSYTLWYTNNNGSNPDADLFKTYVSNDNGATWVTVDTVGPATAAGWTVHRFTVSDFVSPTEQVRVRFEASDLNDASIVEAAVDNFLVSVFACKAPYGDGDFDGDGDVDLEDFATFQLCLGQSAPGPCQAGNMAGDSMIDLEDYAAFAAVFAGPQ